MNDKIKYNANIYTVTEVGLGHMSGKTFNLSNDLTKTPMQIPQTDLISADAEHASVQQGGGRRATRPRLSKKVSKRLSCKKANSKSKTTNRKQSKKMSRKNNVK